MSRGIQENANRAMLLKDLECNREGRLSPAQTQWAEQCLAFWREVAAGPGSTAAMKVLCANLSEDLARGTVAVIDETLIWNESDFAPAGLVVSIPGRPSRLRVGHNLNILPGPYRFYYLLSSGYIVAAELSEASEKTYREATTALQCFETASPVPVTPVHIKHLQQALMKLQGIDARDLTELRARRPPPVFTVREQRWTSVWATFMALSVLCLAAITAGLMLVTWPAARVMRIAATVVVVLGAGAAFRKFQTRNAVVVYRIFAWEGVLQRVERPDTMEESITGQVTIGHRTFKTDHKLSALLFLGLVYRIYYLAESEEFVAIEVLSVDPLEM